MAARGIESREAEVERRGTGLTVQFTADESAKLRTLAERTGFQSKAHVLRTALVYVYGLSDDGGKGRVSLREAQHVTARR